MAHDCTKHLLPAFGFRCCYAELKDRLAAGNAAVPRGARLHRRLRRAAIVGAAGTNPGSSRRLPLYELDAEPSAEDTAILQSLMTVGTQERLEFEQRSRCGVVTTVSKPPRDHRGTHFVEASARRVDTGFYVRLCSSGDGTRTHNLRITVRVPDTGVGEGTLRRYLQLLDLAEELQVGLAAGEVKNTEALPRLAKKFTNPEKQLEVWKSISRFKQDVQPDVLKGPRP